MEAAEDPDRLLALDRVDRLSFELAHVGADRLADALYDVTGRRLELVFALGEAREAPAVDEEPAGEERIYELLQETLDARERES